MLVKHFEKNMLVKQVLAQVLSCILLWLERRKRLELENFMGLIKNMIKRRRMYMAVTK